MQLGFVTAILPELDLEQVFATAQEYKYSCIEVMCWPRGKADRRYAGVTHIDADGFDAAAAARVKALSEQYSVGISALGYYPNPLCADEAEATLYIEHLKKVISAAALLGLDRVNTFVGRDHRRSVADNWAVFSERWPGIIQHAEQSRVRIGIENCPMFFTADEWPGGKNLAISPAIWREMFTRIPSSNFGLNYDPSHLVWQFMDPIQPIHEFGDRIFHVHAKDARIERDKLNDLGILAYPNQYHTPRLPGLGDVNWSRFFAALNDIRYNGAVCVEVEDRAFESDLASRKRALKQSRRFLKSYVS